MSNTIFITANWITGALSQQTISRQYDNNRYAVQFIGYPEGDSTEELDLYLLVWMSTAPGQKPGEITPIQLNSDQWYISNYFTQQVQVIKFQLCVLNEAGTYEAHSPIFSGRIGDSLEHNGTSHDIDVSTLFDAYREYVEELIIAAGAAIIDPAPTQGSNNAVSSGGVYSALQAVEAKIPDVDPTLSQSGQAADAYETGVAISNLNDKIVNLSDGNFSLSHVLFSNGGLEADGTLNNKLYYASTTNNVSFDYPVQINVVDSVTYSLTKLLLYDVQSQTYTSVSTANTINGWIVPANTPFKLQIYKTGIFQNANLEEFAKQVVFETRAEYLTKVNSANITLMQADGSELLPIYFRRGSVSSGNFVSYVYYRITNPDIAYFDRDVNIVAKSGFKFGVHLYNSDDTYITDKGWQTSYFIPANQKFRLVIARVTENTSERADVWEFYSAISIQSSLKDYIDSKHTLSKLAFLQSGRAKLVAHMGYHVSAPENTIASFTEAGKRGFWGIESDVQQTSDGYYVMCHDGTVDRTTDGTGSISSMTLEEIRALHITADTSLKIPTFEEYLAICKRYGCVPIIELKGTITNTKESYLKIFGIVKGFGLLDGCIFIGSKYALSNFRSASEDVPFMPVYQNGGSYVWETEFAYVSAYKNVGLDWDYNLGISLANAEAVHAKGMLYGVFTVDNVSNVMTAFENGADFVTTNTVLPTD